MAKTVGVCGPLVFQLTAARRRLAALATATMQESMVSTHSRPKAAGHTLRRPCRGDHVSTHSRPKAAGFNDSKGIFEFWFQLTAARRRLGFAYIVPYRNKGFQLTAARRRLGWCDHVCVYACQFQLTAARRRLVFDTERGFLLVNVSTHSRPKAAGLEQVAPAHITPFQLTAARRRLDGLIDGQQQGGEFQLTAARRRLGMAVWAHKPA